ncbi:MAG: non-canonical purine NTP pyrophosphatase, partial [Oscillospiraceae bacterium]
MDIIIATNNKGKADEFKRILLPFGINALSLKELNIDADPEETGTTFAQNSKIKAEFIKNITNKA